MMSYHVRGSSDVISYLNAFIHQETVKSDENAENPINLTDLVAAEASERTREQTRKRANKQASKRGKISDGKTVQVRKGSQTRDSSLFARIIVNRSRLSERLGSRLSERLFVVE